MSNNVVINRSYFELRRKEMDAVFNYILPLLKKLAKNLCPNTVRFIASETNKKTISNNSIYDSTPTIAVRNFASGLITGASSPADNWFKLKLENNILNNEHEVKVWTGDVSELIRNIINSSNFYEILFQAYKQLGVFQFACMYMEADYDNVVNFKLLPIGSYRIDKDKKGRVDTVYRNFMMSAKNIIDEFGEENCPSKILEANKTNPLQEFELIHFVCPNPDFIEGSPIAIKKKFLSVTYLVGDNEKQFLRKSGFSRFPYAFFESEVNGESIYSTEGCGVYALPDVKQLYEMIKDKAIATKKMYKPVYKGPASLKNKKLIDEPSAFIEEDENGRGISPVHEVNPAILELRNDINEIKENIKSHFYNDLFAMILNTAQRGRTATEVNELKEEKLVLLSPLLEQIHRALSQIIEWIFFECQKVDILPEIPELIQNQDLKIEFVSTLAQAQKVKKISSMERFATFVINLSSSTQDTMLLKKINYERMIDDYAEYANVDANQLVPTKIVQKMRKELLAQQAQQEQAQQVMNALGQGSEIVKNVGGADAFGGELLTRLGL